MLDALTHLRPLPPADRQAFGQPAQDRLPGGFAVFGRSFLETDDGLARGQGVAVQANEALAELFLELGE